jgi:hypothetical protein
MAVEFQVLTSSQFIRVGAHGELDWESSRRALAMVATEFVAKDTKLALLDVRDAVTSLSDEQIIMLVSELVRHGLHAEHRIAVLHRPLPLAKSDIFAAAAVLRGFDVMSFDDYESAVEWLSSSRELDPDFDREVYEGPSKEAKRRPPKRDPLGGAGAEE